MDSNNEIQSKFYLIFIYIFNYLSKQYLIQNTLLMYMGIKETNYNFMVVIQ